MDARRLQHPIALEEITFKFRAFRIRKPEFLQLDSGCDAAVTDKNLDLAHLDHGEPKRALPCTDACSVQGNDI
jgi:hypothetical protein